MIKLLKFLRQFLRFLVTGNWDKGNRRVMSVRVLRSPHGNERYANEIFEARYEKYADRRTYENTAISIDGKHWYDVYGTRYPRAVEALLRKGADGGRVSYSYELIKKDIARARRS